MLDAGLQLLLRVAIVAPTGPSVEPPPTRTPGEQGEQDEEGEPAVATSQTPASAPELETQPPAPSSGSPRRPAFPSTWFQLTIIAAANAVGLGVEGTSFVVPPLGVGLGIENIVVWGGEGGPFNVFRLTPKLTGIILPRRHVSPIVRAGFGGEFISHRLGVYGRWLTGGGVLFRFKKRFMIELSVDVVGRVPDARWRDHFACDITPKVCSLDLEPHVGFGVGF